MEIGILGLGRMGGGIARRLARGGHHVVGYDPAVASLADGGGVEVADSLEGLASRLSAPRALWLMVPADIVDATLEDLTPLLGAGDVVVDGGNSWYRESMRRAAALATKGIVYLDVGTSGGVWGQREGYCLMIGGDEDASERLRPIFETLAPAPDRGWSRLGPSGAGHYAKMIHNAIEYGMMQSYAEGFALLEAKSELAIDAGRVAEVWRSGSVVRSWLLDLLAAELRDDPRLAELAPWVADSGEGRWAAREAIDLAVPAPVITLSLHARFRSRVENSFADRILAALRRAFGGHAVRPPDAR
ncbi:MAG TPA: decarboxylating 6-phosphogluconate dehydrogenase [Longimicrobiales bacterium]